MIELIKNLANEGFKVRIIEIEPMKSVAITTPMYEIPETEKKSFKVKSVEVVKPEKAKRVNWKTIKKIKEAKEDGLTSEKSPRI